MDISTTDYRFQRWKGTPHLMVGTLRCYGTPNLQQLRELLLEAGRGQWAKSAKGTITSRTNGLV